MKNKILAIVTNIDKYHNKAISTGLWLGELTHFWDIALKNGFEIELSSPAGGNVPIDPESFSFIAADKSIKQHAADEAFMTLLKNTKSINEISFEDFDAIYLTGGHGTMYDFVGNETLNTLIKNFFENGKVVSAVCHGVCGLLDVKMSNGAYLLENKNATGYSWFEETLAMRKSAVPFNLEQKMIDCKTKYSKAFIPLTSHIVVDGLLVTGQNPFSTKAVAQAVIKILKK
jgi:putative intracellular protease/amidase